MTRIDAARVWPPNVRPDLFRAPPPFPDPATLAERNADGQAVQLYRCALRLRPAPAGSRPAALRLLDAACGHPFDHRAAIIRTALSSWFGLDLAALQRLREADDVGGPAGVALAVCICGAHLASHGYRALSCALTLHTAASIGEPGLTVAFAYTLLRYAGLDRSLARSMATLTGPVA